MIRIFSTIFQFRISFESVLGGIGATWTTSLDVSSAQVYWYTIPGPHESDKVLNCQSWPHCRMREAQIAE